MQNGVIAMTKTMLAIVLTVVGFFAGVFIGAPANMEGDLGLLFAILIMGGFIIHSIEKQNKADWHEKGGIELKNIWKYILAGLATAVLCLLWAAWFPAFFNGVTLEAATTLGVGLFLACEMVILTGLIISKMEKKDEPTDRENWRNKAVRMTRALREISGPFWYAC